jgi:hypothetical protein
MNQNAASTARPFRKVLEGVPRAGYDVHMCPFPGSLYACLQYVGDPCDYDYLMGVSGAAFRRLWNRDDGGNVDLSYFGDEPFRLTFEALGYEWTKVPAEKEAMFGAAQESIDRGVPAISFGIIGPPEAGVVAGYGQDGQVLYGWSYFQEQRDHYYEKADWFETMDKNAGKGLIVIGDRRPSRPSDREVLLASLRRAIDLERTTHRPDLPDHVGGLAAYDAWADGMEVDADYPAGNAEVLGTRVMVMGDQVVMVEERHSAAKFLRQMAKAVPEVAESLQAAATLYDEAANFGSPLWPWGYSMGEDAQRGLADAGTRRELAGYARAAQAQEAQAVTHLEQALAALE